MQKQIKIFLISQINEIYYNYLFKLFLLLLLNVQVYHTHYQYKVIKCTKKLGQFNIPLSLENII
jgi:hypothetical protein